MWLKALFALLVATVAIAGGFSIAHRGSAHPVPAATHGPAVLAVTPASGGPATTFVFSFKAPAASAAPGDTRSSYTLSVSGPSRAGCVARRSTPVRAAGPNAATSVALDPAVLGGPWCAGSFIARVVEFQAPVCRAGMMCPQFIRVVGVVGATTFRVTGP